MSLREALYAVNQGGTTGVDYPTGPGLGIDDSAGWSSNQITFNFGGTPRTIELSSDNGGELSIWASVEIVGPGPDKLTIDASSSPTGIRIFSIDSSGTDVQVSISEMRLRGGNVSGDGGAILAVAPAASVDHLTTLSGLVIECNVASGKGGGIAAINGNIAVDSVVLARNRAEAGGGLAIYSESGSKGFTVSNSKIDGNKAGSEEDGGGSGGGIYINMVGGSNDAAMSITRNSITNNISYGDGGGIYIGSYLNLTSATPDVELTIADTTIAYNEARSVGAPSYLETEPNEFDPEGPRTNTEDWPHEESSSDGLGGGVYLRRWDYPDSFQVEDTNNIKFKLINSTISTNFAESGGGLSIEGGLDISHCTIVNNEAGHFVGYFQLTQGEWENEKRVESSGGGGVLISQYRKLRTPDDYIGFDQLVRVPTFSHTILARNKHIEWYRGKEISNYEDEFETYDRFTPNLAITYEGARFPGESDDGPLEIEGELRDLHDPNASDDAAQYLFTLQFSYSIIDDRSGPLAPSSYGNPYPFRLGQRIDFADETFIKVPIWDGPAENDPLIRPLADNGGFKLPDGSTILTHKIVCGSPAWDAGDPSFSGEPYFDQRGEHYPRVHISIIDIGAYELGARDFPALAADFDHDGDVDADDLQVWKDNYGNQAFTGGDANGDEKVDHLDLQIWQDHYGYAVAPPNTVSYGDFNGDNFVDGADFIIWQRNFGKSNPLQGDANGDGIVDGIDFLIWQRSLGQQSGSECWTDRLQFFAQLQPGKIVVSTLDDVDDGYYGLGELSLREAIYIASQNSGFDEIVFAEELVGTIILSAELAVGSELWITGPGAEKLSIDAGGQSRVFSVNSGVEATISGLTVTGGNTTGNGGAIYTDGDLKLSNVDVIANHADYYGGGVFVSNFGTLEVDGSTFDLNTVGAGGGAISGWFKAGTSLDIDTSTFSRNEAGSAGGGALLFYSNINGAHLAINGSTFSGNAANGAGAIAIQAGGTTLTALIENSTIAYNEATTLGAGGLGHIGATVTLHNTILAQNITTPTYWYVPDIQGALSGSSTHNVIGQGGGGGLTHNPTVTGNKVGVDPLLAPLGYYGGRTKTHALKVGSPAIDAGKGSYTNPYDQRGFAREYDIAGVTNGIDGNRDIGAYEASTGTTLIVRSDGDRDNSVDLLATTDSLRLREALALATALAGSEIISFDPSLYAGGMATITLSIDGGDGGFAPDSLAVANTVISGPGADKLTIAGTSQQSVIVATGTSTISGVTITGGGGLTGGGIYADGIVTLRESRVVGNTVSIAGGGIFSYGVLRVIGSEVSDNTVTGASGAGAGIAIEQYNSLYGFDIINSTISGNTASGVSSKGGGLYTYIYDPYLYDYRVINSTITDNSASQGSGVYNTYYQHPAGNGRYLYAGNSMIADNLVGGDVSGNLKTTSANNLLRSGASGGLSTGNTLLSGSATARLKSLEFSSAGTRVHLPYSDSPAIDAGSNSIATSMALEIDQRGWGRFEDWDGVGGETVDIGAVELAFDEIYS